MEVKKAMNESNIPLLTNSVDEKEKEKMELKETEFTKKEDAADTHKDKERDETESKIGNDKGKSSKKNHFRHPSCHLTIGVNVLDRDDKHINEDVNISFEDVLAEPSSSQGFESMWKLSYFFFTETKYWIYCLLSGIAAVPFAILWGVCFAVVAFLQIWILTPSFKFLSFIFGTFKRIILELTGTCLDPFFLSIGAIFGRISVSQKTCRV